MIRFREILCRLVPAWGHHEGTLRRSKGMQPSVDKLEARLVLSWIGAFSAPPMASRAAIFAKASGGGSTTLPLRGGDPGGLGGVDTTPGRRPEKLSDGRELGVPGGERHRRPAPGAPRRVRRREAGRRSLRDPTKLAAVADSVLASLADSDSSTTPETDHVDFLTASSGATSSTDTDKTLTDDEKSLVNTAFDAFVAVAQSLNVDSSEFSALATPQNLELILGGPGLDGGPGGGGPRGSC